MGRWYSGDGNITTLEQIHTVIDKHSKKNGKVYIGSDSFIYKKYCVLSSVICLHGAEGQSGGVYFYKRDNLPKNDYPTLQRRILEEATQSIQLAFGISENVPDAKLELHLDINSDKRAASNKLVENITGYVKASGFNCKIKPDAWAASTIADKHSK